MRGKLLIVLLGIMLAVSGCGRGGSAGNLERTVFGSAAELELLFDSYWDVRVDSRDGISAVVALLQMDQWVAVDEPFTYPGIAYLKTDEGNVLTFLPFENADYDLCAVYKEAAAAEYAGVYRIPKDVLPALEDYITDTGFVTTPGITGYVMAKDGESILVVDKVAQNFGDTGGVSEFYNAIRFADAPSDVKIGDQVNVWFDIVADSYPGQSAVRHLEVLESPRPAGAVLTESQALHRVLTSGFFLSAMTHDASGYLANKVMAVQAIIFNREQGNWSIRLVDAMAFEDEERVYHFRVDDTEQNGN